MLLYSTLLIQSHRRKQITKFFFHFFYFFIVSKRKRHYKRIRKYKNKLDPTVIKLRLKKYYFFPQKKFFTDYMKDLALEQILSKYNLNERERALAIEFFRDIYFLYWKIKQKFVEIKE